MTVSRQINASDVIPITRYIDGMELLDIWSDFDGTGSGNGWSALTFANWLAGFNSYFASEITAGTVVKTDLGACSDGTNHIWAYSAGSGPLQILLLSGQHGEEMLAQWSTMRFFEQFIRSTDPTMVYLRSRIKLFYIPSSSPSAYNSARKNSNSVDPNRNYNFYWSNYSSADPNFAKGASAFSEPETSAVKALIDANNIMGLIDCHNQPIDSFAETLWISPPSPIIASKRQLVYGAADMFATVYSATWAEVSDIVYPAAQNWAAMYLAYTKNHNNALAAVIEMNANAFGSTVNGSVSQRTVSRQAVQTYCGMITILLLRWLAVGQEPQIVPPARWRAYRATAAAATSIASGGSLIDTNTATNFTFDTTQPSSTGGNRNSLQFSFPSPGNVVVTAKGSIKSGGSQVTQIKISISIAGSNQADSVIYVDVPATTDHEVPFYTDARASVSAIPSSLYNAQLKFERPNGGDNVVVTQAELIVEFIGTAAPQKTQYVV
jgi:hypothetical protein